MLIRANTDGTYSANWTPGAVGLYTIHVTIDGIEIGIICQSKRLPCIWINPSILNCLSAILTHRFIAVIFRV